MLRAVWPPSHLYCCTILEGRQSTRISSCRHGVCLNGNGHCCLVDPEPHPTCRLSFLFLVYFFIRARSLVNVVNLEVSRKESKGIQKRKSTGVWGSKKKEFVLSKEWDYFQQREYQRQLQSITAKSNTRNEFRASKPNCYFALCSIGKKKEDFDNLVAIIWKIIVSKQKFKTFLGWSTLLSCQWVLFILLSISDTTQGSKKYKWCFFWGWKLHFHMEAENLQKIFFVVCSKMIQQSWSYGTLQLFTNRFKKRAVLTFSVGSKLVSFFVKSDVRKKLQGCVEIPI